MKLAIILGNGFDIKIGIDTRYTDFYKFFLAREAGKSSISEIDGSFIPKHQELVRMMKSKESPLWSDLELLLGEQIRNIGSVNNVRSEKEYLEQSINDYLCRQQKRVSITDSRPSELRSQLDATIRGLVDLCDYHDEYNCYEVEFITFNYTDVIDRLVEAVNRSAANNIVYHTPYHIHGSIDQTVILGVDNEKQYIYPLDRRKVDELNAIMLKPNLNATLRARKVADIRETIMKADAVLIYGASIGDTDATWWETISRWLLADVGHKVSILGYVGDSNPASATAQAQIAMYGKRFKKIMLSSKSAMLDEKKIEVHKCEDWMFRFLPDVLSVISKRQFENLLVDN